MAIKVTFDLPPILWSSYSENEFLVDQMEVSFIRSVHASVKFIQFICKMNSNTFQHKSTAKITSISHTKPLYNTHQTELFATLVSLLFFDASS